LDSVQEKCNLQTNSLGKSVPRPQCRVKHTGSSALLWLSSCLPPLCPLQVLLPLATPWMPALLTFLSCAAQAPSFCWVFCSS
jgi:hypothetical protein